MEERDDNIEFGLPWFLVPLGIYMRVRTNIRTPPPPVIPKETHRTNASFISRHLLKAVANHY